MFVKVNKMAHVPSSATARDRERLRQAVLEGLGWRLSRIWSTDWLRNREKQVLRVLAALEEAKKPRTQNADKPPDVTPPPPTTTPVLPTPVPTVSYAFKDIDEVREWTILSEMATILTDCGMTDSGELCRVNQRLRFAAWDRISRCDCGRHWSNDQAGRVICLEDGGQIWQSP